MLCAPTLDIYRMTYQHRSNVYMDQNCVAKGSNSKQGLNQDCLVIMISLKSKPLTVLCEASGVAIRNFSAVAA